MVANKMVKKILVGIICTTVLLGGCGKAAKGQVTIGISQIAEHPALDASRDGFIAGLASEGFKDGENVKFDIQNAQGDIANSQLIAQTFVSQNQDMIFAIGTPAAQSAANSTKDIPILITAVTDAVQAGLVASAEKSGTNVAGTSDAVPIDTQLTLMRTLLPNVKKVGILYNTSEINSEIQIGQVRELAASHGLEIIAAGVNNTNDISQTLQSIIGDVDVLYALTDNIIASAMPLITTEAMAKSIAVIGAEEAHVAAGALATEGINYYDLGFQTGLMAAKVLNGEDISQMPVSTLQDKELVINESAVAKLGITIPEDIKARAKMISGGK
ncbi:MAG TPA: ABC transporter substrate-binding protein [Epulopiscium sp.]|nr:ABC transporter substrate-binding protein [Candidatus Epulonipiscium sp.]